MSSKTRKTKGRQAINAEFPAAAAEQALPAPALPAPRSLPNDILWKIVLYSQKHLRLRLVSSSWNSGVIDAHFNPDCGCKTCACNASLPQFTLKRIFLPWISNWNFSPSFNVSSSLLSDLMFEKQQNGSQTLQMLSSFGSRGTVPIANCEVRLDDTAFDDFVSVFSTSQMEHVADLFVSAFSLRYAPAAIKKRANETVGKLKNLEKLELCHWNFDYPGGHKDLHLLVSSLPHLKTLTLFSYSMTDSCLAVFASSPAVSGLVSLSIVRDRLSAAAIRDSLCTSPYLTNLQQLDLSYTNCGDAVVAAICQSRSLNSINSLGLSDCNLHDASIEAMVSSTSMKNLTQLQINSNHISSIGLIRLFECASTPDAPFSRLRTLDCGYNSEIGRTLRSEVDRVFCPGSVPAILQREADLELSIGDFRWFDRTAVKALINIPLMKCVRTLKLTSSDNRACSSIFTPSSQFCSLQSLRVKTDRILWQSLQALVASPQVKILRSLILSSHSGPDKYDEGHAFSQHLDDACCIVIADSELLGNLQSLTFEQPHMSVSVGLIRLLSSPNLSALKHLDCNSTAGFPPTDPPTEYKTTETLSKDDAAQQIVQLLQSKAATLQYLKFPHTKFSAIVREMVRKKVKSIILE